MATPVKFPDGMPYPITISKLIAPVGSYINKGDRLFAYKFWYLVEIAKSPDELDVNGNVQDGEQSKKTIRESIDFFDAPFEGTIIGWNVDVGDEIVEPGRIVCEVKRPCDHDIVYAGICTMCGKEVDERDQVSANLTISHTDTNLKVSRQEANNIGQTNKSRLIRSKKLILVVDLDQTVIHCGVDPTISEWKNDPSNPNYETLRNVKSFVLEEEAILPPMYMGPKPPVHKCSYYVKVRPGLKEFFEKVAPIYEMHIYTMATRAYAEEIAKIIDPDGSLFGNRILSRDENGSLTHKSLERLFPTDQSMVVIIDDRGDVWNWSPNLIKVTPYNFFVGIGDINSNFLPRQQATMLQMGRRNHNAEKEKESEELLTDIIDTEKKLQEKIDKEVKRQEADLTHKSAALGEEAVAQVRNGDITKKIEFSASLEVQQQNRPLAELQKHMHNQQLLRDDDDELSYLKEILATVQSEFYKALELKNGNSDDTSIQELMPKLKRSVFKDCNFVFSGLIPLGTDIQKADIVLWTKMFGASSTSNITENTTHVITKTPGTLKARIAKSFNPSIKVVHPDWVFECLSTWKHVDEKSFELKVDQVASERELEEFKKNLEKRNKNKLTDAVNFSGDLNNGTATMSSTDNVVDLFAGGSSWLVDDELEDVLDSEDDNEDDSDEDEDEYDEFADVISKREEKKRSGEALEESNNKKQHLQDDADAASAKSESESDLDLELLNALDDSDSE
ncbi:hypothetical protein TPHA_0I00240 [Tetrapisispora phaffii CBS 4417]|uniref:RNA polymerase II subunit A C-terminal domain phosphatase n=1 Tax=Tetrapisispora phaffii (strain ATCC 24235 / CBS 4417 / NBRC 1672 / NRRL Y-8282 / UCD 70-5) TaxID=1071381 RepID=G8BXA3_TETPH|nr:hypothetical protein TPHA_0I00240 [Tetrapisispora phaffii CBS 4417]CCE64531.1 hypothetical protein TPHA_0I00240 [Tetrapisispora phaffii CBS 4417]